ncbi:SDR family oxidoreductase [Rhodococcus opacus]|uniref:3-ketoacyl-ACP reductase n=1 Tax=Rhodococcus opacus TaxID=37919 RepID=A0A076F5G1_RHOOP|nr:SDR family oxidoreductase [Rhodococcus opacus]AII10904.1 3-ketoacyl-ACP reductase [Rhodococcus opacus]
MDIRLDGKIALITGASKGIGLAVARGFAESGASVMLTSRKPEALQTAAESIGDKAAWHAANAGDSTAAEMAVRATIERFGRVDILVNNAATNPYTGPTLGIDEGRAAKTMLVNQMGPVIWSRLVWDAWMEANGGVIVNITSAGALTVSPGLGTYDGTKAALVALTRQLAWELSPKVRVVAVAPGTVKTDMARAIWEGHEEELSTTTLVDRLGEPEDIADMVTFLSSDNASWVTGQTFVVDGGMLCLPPGAEHMATLSSAV